MARIRFVRSGLAACFALLLFAAAPALAADGTRIAPRLAQLQAQDSLLEQLQSRAREAGTRAAEAERREREAEINRLTDQAQQAQARADAEAQRNLAAQRELLIQQAKTELHNSAYSRLEIIVGGTVGFFGILITLIVLFITLRMERAAVALAIEAGRTGIEKIQERAGEAVAEIENTVKKIREMSAEAGADAAKIKEILNNVAPGETPKSEEDRKTVADAAKAALERPPQNRSAEDYRAIIVNYHAEEQWAAMLKATQQMQLLHEADEVFAFARFNEAYALGKLNRYADAIAVYEDVVARYGAASAVALRELVAKALVNKGVSLGKLGHCKEVIVVCDDVVARYGSASEAGLRQLVAMALVNKGVALGKLNCHDEAIDVFEDVVTRYGTSSEAALRQSVAEALFNKGVTLSKLNRIEEAIAVYEGVIARYDAANEAALREWVAKALVNKGITLGELDYCKEAIAVFDDVVARFGAASEAGLRQQVAMALVNKARVYARKGSVADAIMALQALRAAGHPLDLKRIAEDSDFDSIRDDPAFKKFLEENNR